MYRSKLEQRLHEGPLAALRYEPRDQTLVYGLVKTYLPDFAGEGFVVEAKGRFRTSKNTHKYVAVREYNPEVDLRFVLSNPDVRAYPGSRMTLGEWMDKQAFQWCLSTAVPRDWRK